MQVLVSKQTRVIESAVSVKNLWYLLLFINEVLFTDDVRRFVLGISDGSDIELEFFRKELLMYVGERTVA